MKSTIRLDDITPDMDWEKYGKIEKILDDAGIKPLIGVVPYNKDENLNRTTVAKDDAEFGEFLRKKKDAGWTIALHGYNHLYKTKKMGLFPLNNFSEFAGIDFETQVRMLSEGRARLLLWDIETDIFMTPAHTYDKNTLRALLATGFSKVTDGFGKGPYSRGELTFYPISRRRSECTSDVDGYTTYVLHTNTMEDNDIESFEQLIREKRDHFIDYSEYMKIEPVKRNGFGNIVEYLTALMKFCLVKIKTHQ